MKTKLRFVKSLLVMAALCLGSSSAWADVEITETYDFGSFITANGTANLTTSGDGIAQSGTSEKVGTVKVIDNLTAGGQTLDLKGRFAVDYQYNAGTQIRFMWRSSATAYQHGLAGQWNSKGTADAQGAARFSVLNLKANDKITFTYSKQSGKAADPYTCKANAISAGSTPVGVDVALASGTEYTMAADGNLDLYFTNNNFAISKIVIVTTGSETVTAPSFAITGSYNKTRKVTISAGVSDAGNDVTTYYTTDGSEPTSSSPNSFTTASKEITVGESADAESTVTVKAISVSSASAESAVASSDVTVGTIIKLAQPIITLTGMGLDNGNYYKQFTFTADATGTYGSPSISVAGTFGGSDIVSPYTATAAGTISVVASAEGYANSDAATLDVDGAAFILARSYDFTQDSYRDGLSVEGNNITITGAGVQVYRITADKLNMIQGLTLSNYNFGFTKAQNSDTRKGLAPRWGAGSITINNWIDGSFALLNDLLSGGVFSTSSNGTFSFGGQINNNTFTSLNIYAPADATVSKTITAAGWATYCSPYALDFTGAIANLTKAYMVTGNSGSTLTLTPITTTIPANTGILLEGSGEVAIPVVASSDTNVDANKLVGTVASTTLTAEQGYVLTYENSVAGFRKNNNDFTLGANTAYLPVDFAGARSFDFFNLEAETTGINAVENAKQSMEGIYNLSGQRVAQPTRGLYIVNGKKIVVK